MRITSWMRVSWCFGLLATLAAGQSASYSVQPVPLPAVGWRHSSGAIADGGQVAFEAGPPPPPGGSVSPESSPFVWDGVELRRLERPVDATYVTIHRFHSDGRVVGSLRDSSNSPFAGCIWGTDGLARKLRPPTGTICGAVDKGGRDLVVGSALFPVPILQRPVLWRDGVLLVVDLPPPFVTGAFEAVNDSGLMLGTGVGGAGAPAPTGQPWLWSLGTAPTLLGVPAGAAFGQLYDLNVEGEAVGNANFGPSGSHAVRWAKGQYTDLGSIPGSAATKLWRLNRGGTAVGTAIHSNRVRGLIAEDTQLAWLDDVLEPGAANWQVNFGVDIANDGRILALAIDLSTPGALEQLVVLTPVP